MEIGVIGVNHKTADLKMRESCAKILQKYCSPQVIESRGVPWVLLSTCNRTEVYYDGDYREEISGYLVKELGLSVQSVLYSYYGKECFYHLAQVISGIDSAVFLETEIQGQAKKAYELSAQTVSLPKELHFLFQKGLKIGKQVRSQFAQNRPNTLEDVIWQIGQQEFQDLTKTKLLFVGASEINKKIIESLRRRGVENISICNRSEVKGACLAGRTDSNQILWAHRARWIDYGWIFLGTAAPEYILHAHEIPETLSEKKVLFDLSVPRNIDPKVKENAKIVHFNIDELHALVAKQQGNREEEKRWIAHMVLQSSLKQIDLFHEKEKRRKLYLSAE